MASRPAGRAPDRGSPGRTACAGPWESLGASVVATFEFPDHHRFTEGRVRDAVGRLVEGRGRTSRHHGEGRGEAAGGRRGHPHPRAPDRRRGAARRRGPRNGAGRRAAGGGGMRRFLIGMGRMLGWLLWTLHVRRGVIMDNLRLAFPEWTDARRREVGKQTFVNIGQMALEFLLVTRMDPAVSRGCTSTTRTKARGRAGGAEVRPSDGGLHRALRQLREPGGGAQHAGVPDCHGGAPDGSKGLVRPLLELLVRLVSRSSRSPARRSRPPSAPCARERSSAT